MADYISREAAIKEFCDDCMDSEWCKSNGESCSRIKNINSVPATDVRPVVRGSWERVEKNDPESNVICTHCKEEFSYIDGVCYLVCDSELPNFCPNCGADMRG